ncbi:MAG: glyoxalase/bleomycin resistance protein/dioxygenase [Bacteroidetes bacterium]|nr:MAG: glyoxalase/bleomycin resistance protein/dioxygenase [Bacteroidota bacterium]
MHKPFIAGIQQVGIGVPDVKGAFKWYRQHFGMDIPVFEEAAEAGLMLPYTGGKPHKRHAILAINMKGGGGFEIWQYTSRTPQPCPFEPQLGDLGQFVTRMKSADVRASHTFMKAGGVNLLSEVLTNPAGEPHFFLKDPYGNIFEIVPGRDWFGKGKQLTGGPEGAMLGVSDIERSKKFYGAILGYDRVVYDKEGVSGDLACLPGGSSKVRRVLLTHSKPRAGSFSKLLGSSSIELIQVLDRSPRKIFEGRFWGDLGFIHLCYDISGMKELKEICEKNGAPFTVDSGGNFDMGEAAGHFTYIEDPDGTLIEFVETFKIPILKKFGWYLDLRKRTPGKALPNWMLKSMGMNRVKD